MNNSKIMKINFLINFLCICLLVLCCFGKAKAFTVTDMVNSLGQNELGARGDPKKKYYNDDNTYTYVTTGSIYTFGFEYSVFKKDSSNKNLKSTAWARTNITMNGESPSGVSKSVYYPTFDFDETGKLQAKYSDNYWNHGELLETYKYAEDGQMLVYDTNGKLKGAYRNWNERILASQNEYYDKANELNHITSDGTYEIRKGDLVTAIYGDNGNLKTNKYDGGGNLVSSYENGIATYKRTSYTPAEAAAAVKKGNNNKITFTFK